jgi:hypothetical protein
MNEKEPKQLCKDPGYAEEGNQGLTDFKSQQDKDRALESIVVYARRIDCPNVLSPEESEASGIVFKNPNQ